METSVIDWKKEAVSVFDSNVNKIFLGTDGAAASSRVGQILALRVEGSIPYSAPLIIIKLKCNITNTYMDQNQHTRLHKQNISKKIIVLL